MYIYIIRERVYRVQCHYVSEYLRMCLSACSQSPIPDSLSDLK